MAKFEMYQQFENRKNGRIAHVEMVDDVHKTINLMYDERNEKDSETGFCLSYPSVSKNWKRLDTFYSASKLLETASGEDTCSDGTSYNQVMSEILVDEASVQESIKTKKKKSKAAENSNSAEIDSLCEFIFSQVKSMNDSEIFIPQNKSKMRTFKTGGHMFAKFNFSSKSATLACRESAVSLTPDKTVNHMFKNLYVFTSFNEEVESKIKTLLNEAYDDQVLRNNKKNNKEEK